MAGFKTQTSSSQIQLCQLFGKPLKDLKIIYSPYQAQNSGDCGVHAIANLTEYCFGNDIWTQAIQFDKSKLRSHISNCIGNNK